MFRKIYDLVFSLKTDFFKNVMTIMTGTAISQIILLVVTPILTRYYLPEDFGFLVFYMSVLTIFGTCATGKYEKAIFILNSNKYCNKILLLSFISSLIVSIILFFLLFFFKSLIVSNFGVNLLLYDWLFSVSLIIVLYSLYTVLNVILNFQKKFKKLALTKVIKSITSVLVSLLCIYYLNDARGLILGEIAGFFLATIFLAFSVERVFVYEKNILKETKNIAVKYKNFPIYNIPSDFMNMGSTHMPVFFLTNYFGTSVTGFYSLAKRLLDAPVSLFSNSILEVFRKEASELYLKKGNCRKLFVKTAKNLVVLSFFPFMLLFVLAPYLFEFFFGEEWIVSGYYARIISIFYFFKFISSPLSYMFYIAQRQKTVFYLQAYSFISSIFIFNLPAFTSINSYSLLWIHSLNLILFYCVMFRFSYKLTKNPSFYISDRAND